MAVVVVDEEGGGVVVFGGEAEGVFGEEVAIGNAGGAGGAGDGAEGGVVVVRGEAVLRGVVECLGDVLVAVMSVKEIEVPILGTHDKRSCGDGFGWIPHKLGADGVAVGGVQPLDTEKVVIDKTEVRSDLIILRLLIVHAAAKAVEGHRDNRITPCPTNGAVFGIVGNRPNTCLSLDERLVAIRIVLGREVVDRRVLVEVVDRVGLTLGGGTIADIVVIVGDLVCRN